MDSQQIEEKVLVALDEIRPFLASDGGDISLVAIENEKIYGTIHELVFPVPLSNDLKSGVE